MIDHRRARSVPWSDLVDAQVLNCRPCPFPDFGGRRASDGQGFAAFGRVVKGMDVVREIQALPAEGQTLETPLRIQRAIRQN